MSISRYTGGEDNIETEIYTGDDTEPAKKGLLRRLYEKVKDNKFLIGAVVFSYIIGITGLIIAFLALSGSGVLYNVLTGKVNIADANLSYMDAAFGK